MPPIWINLERKSDKNNEDESVDTLYECPVYINQVSCMHVMNFRNTYMSKVILVLLNDALLVVTGSFKLSLESSIKMYCTVVAMDFSWSIYDTRFRQF